MRKQDLEAVRHVCELTLLNWHSENLFPVAFQSEVDFFFLQCRTSARHGR